IINGTGSQTTAFHRWGDYTALDVDPNDDTTFWDINEYVPTTGAVGWRLRIGAFNLAGTTPTPTATATATATTTSTPPATPTTTPRLTPTPRPAPTPRPRPTPAPRP